MKKKFFFLAMFVLSVLCAAPGLARAQAPNESTARDSLKDAVKSVRFSIDGTLRYVRPVRTTAQLGFSLDRMVLPPPAARPAGALSPRPLGSSTSGGSSRGVTQWIDLHGPYGAYPMCLAIDPNAPDTVFCTTPAGGVFRSTDGASTWTGIHEGMYYDYPKQIAVDPSNSSVLLCASNSYWRTAGPGADLYKSTDGGDTWSSLGMGSGYWGGAHICRNDPNVYLAGSDGGVWRSTDGGASWSWVFGSSYVLSFCEDPSDPDTIYAGTYGAGIYRTTDRGATWTEINNIGCGNIRIVAVHGQNGNIIYAAGNPTGIFRSTDGGASWTNVLPFGGTLGAWGVACAPSNGDVVYACGEGDPFSGKPGVFVSRDTGATWTKCDLPTENAYASFAMRAAVDPRDPDTACVGLYRAGVFKTTDGGASWSEANHGLKSTFVGDIVSHPTNPNIIWAATVQCGLWKSTDGGKNWFHSGNGWVGAELNATPNKIAMDPSNPDHLLLGGGNSGVWQSFDGGNNWTATSLQSYGEIQCITFAPGDPRQVWAGSSNSSATLGIWKSTDGGTSWLRKKSGVACYGVSVDPRNPDVVVASTGTWFMDYATIQRTTDGGNTWTVVYQGTFDTITDCSMSPVNPDLVWASSFYENVMVSANNGASWFTNWMGFDPVGRPFSILADPDNLGTVYLPCDDDVGLYYTMDFGRTWQTYNAGLWNISLVPLSIRKYKVPLKRVYYTGTMGNGAYAMVLY